MESRPRKKVTDSGTRISVMKDPRTGPYLVLVWDKRERGREDGARAAPVGPKKRLDGMRRRTALAAPQGGAGLQ